MPRRATTDPKCRTCFLLGSGVSVPAGLPPVSAITESVLHGKFRRGSDDSYRPVDDAVQNEMLHGAADEHMRRIQDFLRWLEARAAERYEKESRTVNYEDVAYLAGQIHDDYFGEYENPALVPFIDRVTDDLGFLRSASRQEAVEELAVLAGNAVDFIRDVVGMMLGRRSPGEFRTEHLALFVAAAREAGESGVNIFTLNHDKLLERYLTDQGIDVIDGFEAENDLGIRRWNAATFWREESRKRPFVRLFKLHGSLGWRRFRPRSAGKAGRTPAGQAWSRLAEYVGIRSDRSLERKADADGRVHEELGRSLVLAGTFNKMLDYTRHVFLELHYQFYRALERSSNLIVCGYGFGDKGINGRIAEWMCVPPETANRRLIVIDRRTMNETRQSARSVIAREIAAWKRRKTLYYRQCDLSEEAVPWKELISHLTTSPGPR